MVQQERRTIHQQTHDWRLVFRLFSLVFQSVIYVDWLLFVAVAVVVADGVAKKNLLMMIFSTLHGVCVCVYQSQTYELKLSQEKKRKFEKITMFFLSLSISLYYHQNPCVRVCWSINHRQLDGDDCGLDFVVVAGLWEGENNFWGHIDFKIPGKKRENPTLWCRETKNKKVNHLYSKDGFKSWI